MLGSAYVAIRSLEETLEHGFHIVAYIAGFGQGGGVGNGERHAQHLGKGLGQQGFAAARGSHQQDVAFFQFHVVAQGVGIEHALVVVVHGHGKNFLGLVLPDDVFVQPVLDFLGRKQAFAAVRAFHLVAGDNLVASLDAVVADACAVLHDEVAHLQLAATAERAAQRLVDRIFCGIAHGLFALFLRHLSA